MTSRSLATLLMRAQANAKDSPTIDERARREVEGEMEGQDG